MRRLLKCLSFGALWLLALCACAPGGDARPTSTPLTLPSPTPIAVRARLAATPSPGVTPADLPSPSAAPSATETTASDRSATRATPASAGALARDQAPTVFQSALAAGGIESTVYWFQSGDEPQLMIQYRSPLRNRPGYVEMLEAVKRVAAASFLEIEPPLLTLYIAATDITGTSDTVLRLDRFTVERWSAGELGDADFYNNGFVPSGIVITCADGRCTGVRPTPLPTFPPFPLPTPTP